MPIPKGHLNRFLFSYGHRNLLRKQGGKLCGCLAVKIYVYDLACGSKLAVM
jgi:hypothetical protein